MRISTSNERGGEDLRILKNGDLRWLKSLGICNCQMWVFLNFIKSENLFLEDLVSKHDLKDQSTIVCVIGVMI